MAPINDSAMIKEFNTNMKKKLEKTDRETQKRKVKKYNRDSEDFKNDKIYAWQIAARAENGNEEVKPTQKLNTVSQKKDSIKHTTSKAILRKNEHLLPNQRRNSDSQASGSGQYGPQFESPAAPRRERDDYQYGHGHQSPRPYYTQGEQNHCQYYPQQEYQQWYAHPAPNYYHHPPQPFLGQRGRGRGATPKRPPHTTHNRGGTGMDNHTLIPRMGITPKEKKGLQGRTAKAIQRKDRGKPKYRDL